MLTLVSRFGAAIGLIRTEADALRVLGEICAELGLRSGALFEYSMDQGRVVHLLDTDPERRAAWTRIFAATGVAHFASAARRMLDEAAVFEISPAAYPQGDPVLAFAEQYDLLEGLVVPIGEAAGVAGTVSFSGRPERAREQKTGLLIVGYLLFAKLREVQGQPLRASRATLTPRERQVMDCTSLGKTSPETAITLGMSERTVNQHIENVALKFGTRNRVHTVAELLRLEVLS